MFFKGIIVLFDTTIMQQSTWMFSVKIKAVYCLTHASPLVRRFPLKNTGGGKTPADCDGKFLKP